MTECVPDTELLFPCITKGPADTKPVVLSLFNLCAQFWEANEQWDAGEYAWPTTPNGLVAECTTTGRSGFKEPRFKSAIVGDTFTEGGLVWTMRVPTNVTGIQPITFAEAVVPAGITANLSINESTKLLVDYASGTAGVSYTVQFLFMIAGRQRQGSQIIHVAEK